jgi:hypothetical protein
MRQSYITLGTYIRVEKINSSKQIIAEVSALKKIKMGRQDRGKAALNNVRKFSLRNIQVEI